MATSVWPSQTGAVDTARAGTFIPEIWSDEIVAAYQANLVLANLVKKMSMTGKKGDTIHIPKPTRGVAAAKVAKTAVTIQADTESEVQVVIDKHFEYSRMIEDIVEAQALSSLRQFYTGDAGYALAKQVDDSLFTLGKSFGDGDGSDWTNSATFIPTTTGLAAYAGAGTTAAFNDNAFRALIQKMDDADVPMDNRAFVVPPSLRNAIMGVERYVSSDFVDGRGVQNGKIGNLYGVDVFVTSNCPLTHSTTVKAAFLVHKDTMVMAEQQGIRSQTQYKQEFLGTLYTADTLYGVKTLRPESGFVLAVAA
jgi:HK97 family phage major capsid protein|tara:strand:+ start:396 stop:1319 length:924 start_codon:yes stop_codon:yes gene_type:complete